MELTTVNVHQNDITKSYFFSRKLDQKMMDNEKSRWRSNIFTLPMEVKPREGLQSGTINTIGDLRFIHYRNYKEIRNPDTKLQEY